jgi:hypothetical protein
MKSLILIILLVPLSVSINAQTPERKYDSIINKIFYENIIDLSGFSREIINKRVEKFLLVNDYPIRYIDDNEIYATGIFQLNYRTKALVFHNDHDDWYVYDIVISTKENKIRYRCVNFYTIPSNVKIKTQSWFIERNGFGAGWSTTKIPTTTPKKPLEDFRSTNTKLFANIDSMIVSFQNSLVKTIRDNEDDW